MNYTFLVILMATICFQLGFMKLEKRIIGGEDAPTDKYRWAVSIKGNIDHKRSSTFCGASILNTKNGIYWLITAAHCFFSRDGTTLTNPELWHARVGLLKVDFLYQKHGLKDKKMKKLKEIFNKAYEEIFGEKKTNYATDDLHFSRIIIHPDYQPSSFYFNDIALMKLKEPLPVDQLTGVSTIDLPDRIVNASWPAVGVDCVVVGWGCTSTGARSHPIAQMAELEIWDNDECINSHPTDLDIHPQKDFCAGFLNESYGTCNGDSGSGLICNYNGQPRIAGIVSRGNGRIKGKYPSVFTRVSSYVNWIRRIVGNN